MSAHRQILLYLAILHTPNPELCWKSLLSILGSKCLVRRHSEHVKWRNFSHMPKKNNIPLMFSEFHICEGFIFWVQEWNTGSRLKMWGLILGLLHLEALAVSLPDTCHYHSSPSPFPSLSAPPVMSILIFLCHSKLVNQTFESKLSAGYLYAAPRQKCRFKEAAICRREGSSCCTIRSNLKERGKVREGRHESKVKDFLLLLQTQKWCFTSHLPAPQRKHRLSSGSLPPNATSLFPDVISELCRCFLHWTENSSYTFSSSSLFGRQRIP